jgi:type I restriction enzyme S subunit
MTSENLLQEFQLLANAPGGVARLREMIRGLAIRGQLVGHVNEHVEPQSISSGVEEERKSLTELGWLRASKKERMTTVISSPEWLPAHWAMMALGDVTISVTDGDHLPPPKAANGVPFLVISNVRWGGINFDGCRTVAPDYFAKLDWIRKPIEGDLLYTLVGSFGIPVLVGRVEPFCVQRHIGIIKPSKATDVAYLACALASSSVLQEVSAMATGTAQKTVPLSGLRQLAIPLPPLAEQKRIVEKVDELMTLCDQLEAQQLERERRFPVLSRTCHARLAEAPTPANLNRIFDEAGSVSPDDFRRTILKLAVRGRLVPQMTDEQPAAELLVEIAHSISAENAKRQGVQLPPIAESELEYEVPNDWVWARFRDVAIIASNLVAPSEFLDLPHLAPDNIEKGNGVLLPCATVRDDKVTSSNHRFFAGQIVYSKIRPNLSKVVVVDFDGLCSADMYPINVLIDASYLQRYMLSESFLVQAVKTDTRIAMPKINQKELNAIAVPVPPLAEQRRIVAKVDELMALVDQLEAKQQERDKLVEAFAKAFVASFATA